MLNKLRKMDGFAKNIIVVFAGTSIANLFNLLFQLLIAHKLRPAEFASFNSLLSIFMVISAPLSTIQIALTNYCAEFSAHNQKGKISFLITDLLKRISFFSACAFVLFFFGNSYLMSSLKIESFSSGYILAGLIATAWFTPLFFGAVLGMEHFGWLSLSSVAGGALKLALAFIFIFLGYNIPGALGALLISSVLGLFIAYIPLRNYIDFKAEKSEVNYREIIIYLFPVAISFFCFTSLIGFDMVLVKHFFSPEDSGIYSLAQMVGKIFLFLPGAISMVMFPRTSGLKAKNMDTFSTLKKSLACVFVLCVAAVFTYNLFPHFILKVLTGKAYPESAALGRLFSVSMSFFTLLYILISYFLSVKDYRFIKFLAFFSLSQFIAINLFHASLFQVQAMICITAVSLFLIHLRLAYSNNDSYLKTAAIGR